MGALIRKFTGQREFGILAVDVVIIIVMSFVSPYFFKLQNFKDILINLSLTAFVAVGMTNLLVSGGFDLSVGSVIGLAGAVCAVLLGHGVSLVLSILAGLAVGLAVGLFNGLMIAKVGLNPFIVTLAGLGLFRGLTYVVCNGEEQTKLGAAFLKIGEGQLFGIQAPVWYVIIFVIVGDFALRRLRFFRQNYYIGGNEKAARLSGIRVDRVKIINYVLMGGIAAFAGIVVTARLEAATMYSGTGVELQVITAAIIGGASLSGGEGTALGSFLGALLMVLIINIMTMMSVNVYWQQFVSGAVLLVAVLMDTLRIRRSNRSAFLQSVRTKIQEPPAKISPK